MVGFQHPIRTYGECPEMPQDTRARVYVGGSRWSSTLAYETRSQFNGTPLSRLCVGLRVPVGVVEHDAVGADEREAHAARPRGQQHAEGARVRVEGVRGGLTPTPNDRYAICVFVSQTRIYGTFQV